jgi:hypothetical protein
MFYLMWCIPLGYGSFSNTPLTVRRTHLLFCILVQLHVSCSAIVGLSVLCCKVYDTVWYRIIFG